MTEEERTRLLEQLVHEQELEMRLMSKARYRHDRTVQPKLKEEPLDVALGRHHIVQQHILEWLDPTFDEVALRTAA